MDLNLQPRATTCFVSGQPFAVGDRVASLLVRPTTSPEVTRYDILEAHVGEFTPMGFVACSWVRPYKPRAPGDTTDRDLKLTAESLFVTLADPLTETTPENTRLMQFIALMLERKRLLRPKGRTADGERTIYEHAKTKQLFEVPVGELTPEFFIQVQEQLTVLVGAPKAKTAQAAPAPATDQAPVTDPAAPAAEPAGS